MTTLTIFRGDEEPGLYYTYAGNSGSLLVTFCTTRTAKLEGIYVGGDGEIGMGWSGIGGRGSVL